MDVSRTRALRGPNLWCRHMAVGAVVTCAENERAVGQMAGFEARLRALFPAIGALHPETGGGDVSLAHVLQTAALALQAQAGCPVTFARTTATTDAGVYQVVVEYSEEAVGRKAFEYAQQLIKAAQGEGNFDADTVIAELRELDEDERLGPSTGSIVDAAVARGIPYRRLTRGSLVQFGWGSKQRRIQAAEVDSTSAVAESIGQDKDLTKRLLHAAGVPVPLGKPVESMDEAWEVAQKVGLPVVVKPQDGNQGKGVTVNITDRAQLEEAYKNAAEHGPVMVEGFLPGHNFRLLVVGAQLVAAPRREPPQVLGDGQHTVRELVDLVNLDPRRGEGHATSLTKIRLDDIALARLAAQGLSPDAVPAEVAARAVAAAQMVGLHICGVDMVAETVLRPLEEQGGGFVEVNAAPGLRMHLAPSYGKPRNVGQAMVDRLYAH